MKALVFFLTVFLIACEPSKDERFVDEPNRNLTGSWTLASSVLGDSIFDSAARPSAIIQKHLTQTHFASFCYDPDTDGMIGMAGGTYKVLGNEYIEVIDYYLPSGSNEVGQQQIYSYELDEQGWTLTGFDKIYDFEPGLGGIAPTDSTFMEQRWSRIDTDVKNDPRLQGTWVLKKYRSESDSVWQTYPDFVGYLKLITPSHFFWIKYNGQYDEVMASGGGPYAYYGGSSYQEKIESFYPHDSHQVGTEITFSVALEDHAWGHQGYIKRIDRGIEIDSTLIDEIWNIYQKPATGKGTR